MTDLQPPVEERPRSRRWFVVLACITLVGFVLFTAAVTVIAFRLPEIRSRR